MAVDTDAGVFLPTTDVFDRSIIDTIDVNSDEFKDFLVRLYQTTNNIALVTNIKESGYYVEQEFVNGQLWFPNPALTSKTPQTPEHRQVFRTTVNFGALPNATTKDVAHGITITSNLTFTKRCATATDTTAGVHPAPVSIDIPYASVIAANNSIEMIITKTSVRIDTGAVDRSAFDTCYVVLEYIKS